MKFHTHLRRSGKGRRDANTRATTHSFVERSGRSSCWTSTLLEEMRDSYHRGYMVQGPVRPRAATRQKWVGPRHDTTRHGAARPLLLPPQVAASSRSSHLSLCPTAHCMICRSPHVSTCHLRRGLSPRSLRVRSLIPKKAKETLRHVAASEMRGAAAQCSDVL